MEYRKAGINDLENLLELRMALLSEANDHLDNQAKTILITNNRAYLKKELGGNHFISWVADNGGELVGCSGICFYDVPPSNSARNGKIAYIMNMYVKPQFRRAGIATDLFSKIVDEARLKGCSKIQLSATSMVRPVYKKYGFQDADDEMYYFLKD